MNQRGFTLIELLVVIAIMGVTMAIGLPSFKTLIVSSRLSSAANAMVSALQLARTEALKQNKIVMVQANTSWVDGWIVYVDVNNNQTQDTADVKENTIARFDALKNTTVFASRYPTYASYNANGRINLNGRFSFCTEAGADQDFRSVVIEGSGRIHIESTTTTPASTYSDDCQ